MQGYNTKDQIQFIEVNGTEFGPSSLLIETPFIQLIDSVNKDNGRFLSQRIIHYDSSVGSRLLYITRTHRETTDKFILCLNVKDRVMGPDSEPTYTNIPGD